MVSAPVGFFFRRSGSWFLKKRGGTFEETRVKCFSHDLRPSLQKKTLKKFTEKTTEKNPKKIRKKSEKTTKE